MFTGIVEEVGSVRALSKQKNLFVLEVKAKKIFKGIRLGDSVAVNGVCLTVAKTRGQFLFFDIMKTTISSTSLKNIGPKGGVNLERALTQKSRFGGHFVTGHVDAASEILDVRKQKNFVEFVIAMPKGLKKYFVPKGSVTIDGISLTVGEIKHNQFSVYLIPFTLKETTLGEKKPGDLVNIETDIIAKYLFNK